MAAMLAIPGDDTQARRDCTMMPDEDEGSGNVAYCMG